VLRVRTVLKKTKEQRASSVVDRKAGRCICDGPLDVVGFAHVPDSGSCRIGDRGAEDVPLEDSQGRGTGEERKGIEKVGHSEGLLAKKEKA